MKEVEININYESKELRKSLKKINRKVIITKIQLWWRYTLINVWDNIVEVFNIVWERIAKHLLIPTLATLTIAALYLFLLSMLEGNILLALANFFAMFLLGRLLLDKDK